MTPDGHGGLWLLGEVNVNLNLVQYWYHYNAGRWTRQLVPSPKGYNDVLFGIALVPGTTAAWAVGEADANHGTGSVGVIARKAGSQQARAHTRRSPFQPGRLSTTAQPG